jgi:predicted phosphate transport protein (TIGR00153 family)
MLIFKFDKMPVMPFGFTLLPKSEDFYGAFIALAAQLRVGSGLLEDMLDRDPAVWDKAEEIKEMEHKCDTLTHQIIQRLNTTFVTPIDREDIHALAKSLDDVMDMIDASARLIRLYKIGTVRYGARELAHVVSVSIDQVRLALEALEKRTGVAQRAVEINRLENEADRIHEEAVRRLFDEERDPIMIMKWKEILDFLEDATDRCEDVANLLEGVVVKNA